MRVERELEIGKWLKTAETEMEIKPNQYFVLVKLLEDFHNEQLRLYGVSNCGGAIPYDSLSDSFKKTINSIEDNLK